MDTRLKVFDEFRHREMGLSPPRAITRRISASEVFLKHLDLYGKLHGHDGCVNTVHFNSTGDSLVSGSDDLQVIFWDWATKTKRFSYGSGHTDNIFQAKTMPFTDDRIIITSSADGQVRLGQVLENGEVVTKRLGKHQDGAHNLAIEPGSPHIFYSCGEDGFVQHFDLRRTAPTSLFSCSSFPQNKQPQTNIQLNAIVIDPRNPNYFAVGGYDGYARVYDIRKYEWNASRCSFGPVNTFCPHRLIGYENLHITGLAYSNTSELLVSYNDELVYLFQKDMGLGPDPCSILPETLQKLDHPQVYTGHRNSQTVKGVNFFGPNDEFVVSGSDCGHIFIWRKKGAELLRMMVGDRHIVNCLERHPHLPVLATSGIEKNVKLWAPMSNDCVPLPKNAEDIMEANRQGREDRAQITLTPDVIMHVLRLQRRQALAHVESRYTRADFESNDDEREGYVVRFADDDASEEEGSASNPQQCNIS